MANSIYGLKIFSPSQMQRLDAQTLEEWHISTPELIERAAKAFVDAFTPLYPTRSDIAVFCGPGNNGADGLVIAHLLTLQGQQVTVFHIAQATDKTSDAFRFFFEKWKEVLCIHSLHTKDDLPALAPPTIVIDALFGAGLNKPIVGMNEVTIRAINESGCAILAVDIASGLMASAPSTSSNIIRPTKTFTFQLPKLSFFLPSYNVFTGSFEILDLQLSNRFIAHEPTCYQYLQKTVVAKILRDRNTFSHKGTYGHVLLFAGSFGKTGAALLAAKAALRTGCGLVSILSEERMTPIIQASFWEAMCISYQPSDRYPMLPQALSYTLGTGPGIGLHDQALTFLTWLLERQTAPVLLDADALNLMAQHPVLWTKLPANSILTPHPKEFERIVGPWANDYDRLEKQIQFSITYRVFVVVKGAYSSISTPTGIVYFNSTGNPGMATAGSGDVLSGILTSLLAQQYAPEEAVVLGVLLHGLAGDLAAKAKGEQSLIASDIIDFLSDAFQDLSLS